MNLHKNAIYDEDENELTLFYEIDGNEVLQNLEGLSLQNKLDNILTEILQSLIPAPTEMYQLPHSVGTVITFVILKNFNTSDSLTLHLVKPYLYNLLKAQDHAVFIKIDNSSLDKIQVVKTSLFPTGISLGIKNTTIKDLEADEVDDITLINSNVCLSTNQIFIVDGSEPSLMPAYYMNTPKSENVEESRNFLIQQVETHRKGTYRVGTIDYTTFIEKTKLKCVSLNENSILNVKVAAFQLEASYKSAESEDLYLVNSPIFSLVSSDQEPELVEDLSSLSASNNFILLASVPQEYRINQEAVNKSFT